MLADPSEWAHDPWSGDVVDGFLWGRGALDMKSQVAAEAVAGARPWPAAAGGRHAGTLKLVFVSDEETGGDVGAHWLTDTHPDRVRCDMLLNEGGGEVFEFDGRRRYGVCCAEKGIFRFKLTARGAAGHASLPKTGDNALLKLGAGARADRRAAADVRADRGAGGAAARARRGPGRPGAARSSASRRPTRRCSILVEPMLGVTLTPTMAHASDKINVIPSRASLKVDCRVPPGLGEDAARRRIEQVLGDAADAARDRVHRAGHRQRLAARQPADGRDRPLGRGQRPRRRDRAGDPARLLRLALVPRGVPRVRRLRLLPAAPQTLLESAPLVHNANERIDVRDLGFAAACYTDLARELLG